MTRDRANLTKRNRERPTIKQIIPADGWCAVFAQSEPDEFGRHYHIEPLAVWALVEEGGFTYVAGLAGSDMVDAWRTWESPSLIEYVRINDVGRLHDYLNERAKAWVRLEAAT